MNATHIDFQRDGLVAFDASRGIDDIHQPAPIRSGGGGFPAIVSARPMASWTFESTTPCSCRRLS